MKHFLRNFRENLAKVIPHLVESQVSLRKILSPGVSLRLRVRTYILAIQKKSFQSWALGPENFPLKISVCYLLAWVSLARDSASPHLNLPICTMGVPAVPVIESSQGLGQRKCCARHPAGAQYKGAALAMTPSGNPIRPKLPAAGSLAFFS